MKFKEVLLYSSKDQMIDFFIRKDAELGTNPIQHLLMKQTNHRKADV